MRLVGELLLLMATLLPPCSSATATAPIVTVSDGQLQGSVEKTKAGKSYHSYKGIPYAKPPVGDLRFQLPEPAEKWDGVRDATKHGQICIQDDVMLKRLIGREDCLFLNVYTPVAEIEKSGRPVMMWIHGGGFVMGSGNSDIYGAGYLLDEDVVLVTINYRLGVFGFLSTDDEAAPGNYGLHDQTLALQWIQDNIRAFGGDPGAVTIFGESAGGASVHYLMLSPLTTGLFQRAISQSGAATCHWAFSRVNRKLSLRIAEALDCSTSSSQQMVECLRKKDAMMILKTQEKNKEWDIPAASPKPTVDVTSPRPFLPEDPYTLMEKGAFQKVPWMAGFNRDEGSLMLAIGATGKDSRRQELNDDFERLGPLYMGLKDTTNDPVAVSWQIRKFYTGDDSLFNFDAIPGLVQMDSERLVNVGMDQSIKQMSRHIPVFKYLFAHETDSSLMTSLLTLMGNPKLKPFMGVSHADELSLFFTISFLPVTLKENDITMKNILVSLWTTFARTGVPTTSQVTFPPWPLFNESNQQHMVLTLEPSIDSHLYKKRIDFWHTLPIYETWRTPQELPMRDEL